MTISTWTYRYTASGRLRITLTTTEGWIAESTTWLGNRAIREMKVRGLSFSDMTREA